MSSEWALSKKEVDFIHYKYGKTDEEIWSFLDQRLESLKEGENQSQFDLRITEWLKNGKPVKEVDTESGYDRNECFGMGFDPKDQTCRQCGIRVDCKEASVFFAEMLDKEVFGMSKMKTLVEDEVEEDKVVDEVVAQIRELKVGVDRDDSGIKIHTMPKMTIPYLTRDEEGKIVVYSSKGLLPYVNRWEETKEDCKVYKQSRIGFRIALSDLVDFIENMLFDPAVEESD